VAEDWLLLGAEHDAWIGYGSGAVGGKRNGPGSVGNWPHEGSHDSGDSTFEVLGSGGGVWRREELDDWLNTSSHDAGDAALEVLGNEGGVVWKKGTSL